MPSIDMISFPVVFNFNGMNAQKGQMRSRRAKVMLPVYV